MKVFSVGMGKFAAGFWADVVDETIIVSGEKGTGNFLQDVIIILIYSQVLVDELLRL